MDASTVIGIVGAVIALAAMFFAGQQAMSARAQTAIQEQLRRDAAQPVLWADIRPSEKDGVILHLVIGNLGQTVATDVVVTFEPPIDTDWLPATGERKLASLPPGREMTWGLGSGLELVKESGSPRHVITLRGTGPFGPMAPVTFTVDLDDYWGTVINPPGSLADLGKAMGKVSSAVENVSRTLERGQRRAERPMSEPPSAEEIVEALNAERPPAPQRSEGQGPDVANAGDDAEG